MWVLNLMNEVETGPTKLTVAVNNVETVVTRTNCSGDEVVRGSFSAVFLGG